MRTITFITALCILAGLPTADAQEAQWRLVWEDDFERSGIGDDWQVGRKASIVDGRLKLQGVHQAVILRSFAPDVRLEFEARSLPGIPPCDLSATLACGDRIPRGYLLGFGARGNRAHHLMGPGVHWANEDPEFVIEPEKDYHLVAQKEGSRITYTVNGTTIIDQQVPDPVGGPNFDRVGVLTWTGMTIDNVRVYERVTAHPDTPRGLDRLPEGPLYRDGHRLRIREGHETTALKKAVEAFNANDLDTALARFVSLGSSLAGLLGQAYVYGDLNHIEPVYHATFEELADQFEQASRQAPDNDVLADYALATRWFSDLVMTRKGSGNVAVIRLEALGPENNPYYHKALLYRVRYQYWGALEGGLPAVAADARKQAQSLLETWPENRILRQYAGERVPWGNRYQADPDKHPAWAAYLREAYARAIAMMERFIEVRQRPDGQFGGGYGDDVEMMRSWMQVAAISSASEDVRSGIERLAEGVWDNVLLKGYDRALSDVEHTAEASADTLPGMLLLRHGDPLWYERNLESCHTIKTCFMGLDVNGHPRFKSSSIGKLRVGDPLLGGGDTGYCARAMKHFLWAAWHGNVHARDWLVGWADGWRGPSIRDIDGKIAGFVPLTLWYPTSSITPPVEGKTWHDKRMNYWSRPDMIHDTFLAAYWLTEDSKFLMPFQMAMRLATRGPLPRGDLERGSREWQLASIAHLPNNMGTEQNKVMLYRWLTGDRAYDAYARSRANATMRYQLNGDLDTYLEGFESAAKRTRFNLDMMTSEVMAMDRAGVPAAMMLFGAYTGAISSLRDMATPTFAVTYDTPTTDFAGLVVFASKQRLRLWLYHFDDETMPIGLKLWRLEPGMYVLDQGEQLPGETEDKHRYAWEPSEEVACLHRGDGPTIHVPPGKIWAVDLRLKSSVAVPMPAPDLAIMPRDIQLKGNSLSVTIHNIGSGDAGPFDLIVETATTGEARELARQRIPGLDATRDLLPSTTTVSLALPGGDPPAAARIRVQLASEGYEACAHNNFCRLKPDR